jgi:asparagine synthase (glutamine-hydrolysing)
LPQASIPDNHSNQHALVALTERLPEYPGYFGEMVWILMMLEQRLAAKAPGFSVPG